MFRMHTVESDRKLDEELEYAVAAAIDQVEPPSVESCGDENSQALAALAAMASAGAVPMNRGP
jgi:hypothetical protein